MSPFLTRRNFLSTTLTGMTLGLPPTTGIGSSSGELFKLSVNEVSLRRAMQTKQLHHLHLVQVIQDRFALDAVEYVTSYFSDRREDPDYLRAMNREAAEYGVRQILVAVDDGGALATTDSNLRAAAVSTHCAWIDAAKILGCHAIRVSVLGDGTDEEQQDHTVASLTALATYGAGKQIQVLLTNDHGPTARADWIVAVMRRVDSPFCGTAPNFVHFTGETPDEGLRKLMPFAGGVSVVTRDFDDAGNEITTDLKRMMQVVLESGYHGHVSIEYRGTRLDDFAGVLATRRSLERLRGQMNAPLVGNGK